jgi:hypothetical protein
MTGPGYDLLVVLHALSAVVGFGAVGVTGVYAASARSAPNPSRDAKLVRYFRPGTNWAERTMVMTPVLGAIVLAVGDHPAASQAWPWAGLGCGVGGAGAATGWCWPAERRIQDWLNGGGGSDDAKADLAGFRRACRDVQWAASAISVLFLIAVVVMIGQPS